MAIKHGIMPERGRAKAFLGLFENACQRGVLA
jgi:hypothetical protein